MAASEICYACGAPATTSEHVPPKVFFPEAKDSSGVDYRKNLLTVPSCPDHNNAKSLDDEYAAYVVATSDSASKVALSSTAQKALRALQRSPGLLTRFVEGSRIFPVADTPRIALKVDRDAFEASMTAIARALHFHRTQEVLQGDLIAKSLALFDEDPRPGVEVWQKFVDKTAVWPWIVSNTCENPEVFQFRYLAEHPVFHLMFYEGFHVFVLPRP